MAQNFLTLPIIPQPFANGGSHADIPNDATMTNRASYQEGFPEKTSLPITDDPSTTGIPPNRLDFNGLGYIATAFAFALQQGKFWSFDVNVANAIGGYPKGAVLWVKDSVGMPLYMVQSLIANNTYNFLTTPSYIDGEKWQKISINPLGDSMIGTLDDVNAPQIRNIEIVETEPETGVDGTIYAIVED